MRLCLSQAKSPLLKNPCKQTLCEALPFLKEKMTNESSPVKGKTTYGGL
jgi:hypothetical protein